MNAREKWENMTIPARSQPRHRAGSHREPHMDPRTVHPPSPSGSGLGPSSPVEGPSPLTPDASDTAFDDVLEDGFDGDVDEDLVDELADELVEEDVACGGLGLHPLTEWALALTAWFLVWVAAGLAAIWLYQHAQGVWLALLILGAIGVAVGIGMLLRGDTQREQVAAEWEDELAADEHLGEEINDEVDVLDEVDTAPACEHPQEARVVHDSTAGQLAYCGLCRAILPNEPAAQAIT